MNQSKSGHGDVTSILLPGASATYSHMTSQVAQQTICGRRSQMMTDSAERVQSDTSIGNSKGRNTLLAQLKKLGSIPYLHRYPGRLRTQTNLGADRYGQRDGHRSGRIESDRAAGESHPYEQCDWSRAEG